MSYSTVPTVAPGDAWSASQHNTYLRDNLSAIWKGTTAGDMDYYSGPSDKTRLPLSPGSMLMAGASAPVWVSGIRYVTIMLNDGVALTAGDDAARFRIPAGITGWNLVSIAASRKSGTGTLTLQVRNVSTGHDMLSTRVTVDSSETDSSTAAVPAVIDTNYDDVSTAQQLAIDVDDPGASTLCAVIQLGFGRP